MTETELQIYNRLKFGMSKSDIRKELGLSIKTIHRVYVKYGFDKIEAKNKSRMPQELLKQWDLLHERYGTIPQSLLREWDIVTGRLRACRR